MVNGYYLCNVLVLFTCRLQTFHADHQVELVHFKSEIHSYTTQMKETKETIKKLEDEVRSNVLLSFLSKLIRDFCSYHIRGMSMLTNFRARNMR